MREQYENLSLKSRENLLTWCSFAELLDFCTFFPSPGVLGRRNTTFRKWYLFPSSGKREENTPTQLDPLEKANLNHWTRSPPLHLRPGPVSETSCFYSQEHRTIHRCYTPSSETFKTKWCSLYNNTVSSTSSDGLLANTALWVLRLRVKGTYGG
jgi:hypothetical protein